MENTKRQILHTKLLLFTSYTIMVINVIDKFIKYTTIINIAANRQIISMKQLFFFINTTLYH